MHKKMRNIFHDFRWSEARVVLINHNGDHVLLRFKNRPAAELFESRLKLALVDFTIQSE